MRKRDLEKGRFPLFKIGTVCEFTQLLDSPDVKYINGCVGWDGRIHLLFQDGSDPSHRAIVVVITLDWHDGSVISRDVVHFNKLPFSITHIETCGTHYLLVDGGSERFDIDRPNCLIMSKEGQIIRAMVLGSDIQQCIVRRSRDIVVGYGDIGVFVTGMTQGVVVFNENAKLKWANSRYDIVHSYATHDSGDRLWFYFYTEFKLAFTKLCCTSSKCTDLSGCEGFLIHNDGKHAVFASPWHDEHAWYWVHRTNQKWKKIRRGIPTCKGEPLKIKRLNFERSKFFCLDEDGVFYGNTIEEPPYKLLWFKKRNKRMTVRFYPSIV